MAVGSKPVTEAAEAMSQLLVAPEFQPVGLPVILTVNLLLGVADIAMVPLPPLPTVIKSRIAAGRAGDRANIPLVIAAGIPGSGRWR